MADRNVELARSSIRTPPIGALIDYAGTKLPPFCVWPDGRNLDRAKYAALFEAITIPGTNATINSGSATIVATFNQDQWNKVAVGMAVEGPGIPAGATLTGATYVSQDSLAGTAVVSFTVSAAATAGLVNALVRICPFGNGNGTTTFGVPDVRGRVVAARDNLGGTDTGRIAPGGITGHRLGAAAGVATRALGIAELPYHNHGVNDPTHAHGVADGTHGHGVSDGSHRHLYDRFSTGGTAFTYSISPTSSRQNADSYTDYRTANISVQANYAYISIHGAYTGVTIQHQGSGAAFSMLQPTLILDKVLFAGA